MPKDTSLTHFQTLDEAYHDQEVREGIDHDPRYWQIVEEIEKNPSGAKGKNTFEQAKTEFATRYPEEVARMREDAKLVTARSIEDPTYKRLLSQQEKINRLANVTATPESLRQQVIQRMIYDHPGKAAHYAGIEDDFSRAVNTFTQENPTLLRDPQTSKKYAAYQRITNKTQAAQVAPAPVPMSPVVNQSAQPQQHAAPQTISPIAAKYASSPIQPGETLEQYSARRALEHAARVRELKGRIATNQQSRTGFIKFDKQVKTIQQNLRPQPTKIPPSTGRLKSFAGNTLGSIYMLFSTVGKPMQAEQRTTLHEQYAYVGNGIMARLPLLRSQASNWTAITKAYQSKFPELSQIRSTSALMAWIAAHKGALPHPEAALQAVRSFEEYYSYFPEGGQSEALQSRLRVEMQNEFLEQQAQEGLGAGSHGGGGGGGAPANHALEEEQEERARQAEVPAETQETEKEETPQSSTVQSQPSATSATEPSQQPAASQQTLRQSTSPWKGRLAGPGRALSGGTRSAVAAGANRIPRLASRIPNPLGGLPLARGLGGIGGLASKGRLVVAGAGLIGPWGIAAAVFIILFIVIFGMASPSEDYDVDVDYTQDQDYYDTTNEAVAGAKTMRGEVLQDSIESTNDISGDGTESTGDTGSSTDTSGDSIGNNDDTSGEVDIGSYKPAKYTITVTVKGSADNVIVTLPLDKKAALDRASTPCVYETISDPYFGSKITWNLNQAPTATTLGKCAGQPSSSQTTQTTPSPSPSQEQSSTPSAPSTFPSSTFQGYGFPAPQNPNPQQMGGDVLNRWNSYIKANAQKAAAATGVDIGIIGMWPWLEGGFVPFDNCDQEHNVPGSVGDGDHNTQCPYWNGEWQVGLGLHPAYTHQFVKDAFDTMYGNHDNATVQRVGQNVIGNMKTRYGVNLTIVPSTFPSESIDNIISGALRGDLRMRNLLTTLMKDEAIGIYMIARHFKDNIGIDSGMASQMEGWSSSYYNRQKIVNYIKGIYDAGVTGGTTTSTGNPPSTSTTGIVNAGTYQLTVWLVPIKGVDNDFVNGYAEAEMINPKSGPGGSTQISGTPSDTSGEVDVGNPSDPTLACTMASPVPDPWPLVNRWNALILDAIRLAKATEGVEVAGNVVKAIMMMESGGIELAPNMSGYMGLMQVATNAGAGGGSNCDWHKPQYNVYTTQGNLNCGVQHLARGLKTCNGQMAAVIGQYFTGQCNYSNSGPDGFGTTPNAYVNKVLGTYNYLNEVSAAACK